MNSSFCHIPQGGHAPKEANSSSPVSGQSPQSPGTQQRLQKWNPMEVDFLAERNSYKIDDEDTVSALHGYSKILAFHFTLRTQYSSTNNSLHVEDHVHGSLW